MSPRQRMALQSALLTTWSFLLVVPYLNRIGPNIVTTTYLNAAHRLWHGVSPYLPPESGADWFKYSPFFAFAYGMFLPLSPTYHALLWALLNAAVFWAGLSRWVSLRRDTSPWVWAGLVFASMEVDGALRYQQVNALIVGLVLWGLAEFREGRSRGAGRVLTLGTNLKLLPGLFVLPLFFSKDAKAPFYRGMLLVAAVTVFLPTLATGDLATIADYHRQWLALLKHDAIGPGLGDIGTILGQWGVPAVLAILVRQAVLLATLGILTFAAYRGSIPWSLWISVGVAGLLLSSPRTETPTYVLLSPAYVLTIFALEDVSPRLRRVGLVVWALAALLVSVQFNDIYPRILRPAPEYYWSFKCLGTFLLWSFDFFLLARAVRQSAQALR